MPCRFSIIPQFKAESVMDSLVMKTKSLFPVCGEVRTTVRNSSPYPHQITGSRFRYGKEGRTVEQVRGV